jgi:hypothetical protein
VVIRRVLNELEEMKYDELSIDGTLAERGEILKMPICLAGGKALEYPLINSIPVERGDLAASR